MKNVLVSLSRFAARLGLRSGSLVALVVVGTVVRLGMYALVDFRTDVGDAASYHLAATNLLATGTYSEELPPDRPPTNFRPPLYSVFVAAVMVVFGDNPLVLRLLQLVLSLVAALLVSMIAAKFAPNSARWVLALMLVSPFEAVYTGAMLTETLTAFLLLMVAWCLAFGSGLRAWGVAGFFAGLVILCRDIYLPLFVFVGGAWALFGDGRPAARWRSAILMVGVSVLVVAPWTVRNAIVTGRFVPVSSGRLGLSLWAGSWATNAEFTKSDSVKRVFPDEAFRNDEERQLVQRAMRVDLDRRESERIFKELAIGRIKDEPIAVVGRWFRRAPKLWLGTRFDIFQLNARLFPYESAAWRVVKSLLWGINLIQLLLALLGAVLVWRARSPIAWFSLPIVFTAAVYLPLNSFESRYSEPVLPFVLLFAGVAFAFLFDRLKERLPQLGALTGSNT